MRTSDQSYQPYLPSCLEKPQCSLFQNQFNNPENLHFRHKKMQEICLKKDFIPKYPTIKIKCKISLRKSLLRQCRSVQKVHIRLMSRQQFALNQNIHPVLQSQKKIFEDEKKTFNYRIRNQNEGNSQQNIKNGKILITPEQQSSNKIFKFHENKGDRPHLFMKTSYPKINIQVINIGRGYNSPLHCDYNKQEYRQHSHMIKSTSQGSSVIDEILHLEEEEKGNLNLTNQYRIIQEEFDTFSNQDSILDTPSNKNQDFQNKNHNKYDCITPSSIQTESTKILARTIELKKGNKNLGQKKWLYSSQDIQTKFQNANFQDVQTNSYKFSQQNSSIEFSPDRKKIRNMKQIEEIHSLKDEDDKSLSCQESEVIGRLNDFNVSSNAQQHQQVFFDHERAKKKPTRRLNRYESYR